MQWCVFLQGSIQFSTFRPDIEPFIFEGVLKPAVKINICHCEERSDETLAHRHRSCRQHASRPPREGVGSRRSAPFVASDKDRLAPADRDERSERDATRRRQDGQSPPLLKIATPPTAARTCASQRTPGRGAPSAGNDILSHRDYALPQFSGEIFPLCSQI